MDIIDYCLVSVSQFGTTCICQSQTIVQCKTSSYFLTICQSDYCLVTDLFKVTHYSLVSDQLIVTLVLDFCLVCSDWSSLFDFRKLQTFVVQMKKRSVKRTRRVTAPETGNTSITSITPSELRTLCYFKPNDIIREAVRIGCIVIDHCLICIASSTMFHSHIVVMHKMWSILSSLTNSIHES